MALTLICLIIHVDVAPKSRFALRKALVNVQEIDPVDLLDEGRFVKFPRLEIYITRKNGYKLRDIEVYELDGGGKVVQTIRAKTGTVEPKPDLMLMRVMLQDAQVQYPDSDNPEDLTRARVIDMENYDFDVSYEDLLKNKNIVPKIRDMTASQLLSSIEDVNLFYDLQGSKREAFRMQAIVEGHKRITLSLACLGFTLIGIPLGIKSKRKESSVGVGVSLIVVIVFYGFTITAEALVRKPWMYPEMILWIPTVIFQAGGLLLLRRMR
jgi:lipopolysaccharide export system permease protein